MTHMIPAAKYTGLSATGQPSVGRIGQAGYHDLEKVVVMPRKTRKPQARE